MLRSSEYYDIVACRPFRGGSGLFAVGQRASVEACCAGEAEPQARNAVSLRPSNVRASLDLPNLP